MPADYLARRSACYAKVRKSKGRPPTKSEKDACKKSAAIWWVKKHGKPFPQDASEVPIKDVKELQGFILSDDFWNDNFNMGVTWAQQTDDTISYDAVDEILSKIGAHDSHIRIKQNDSSKYKKFRIKDFSDGVKAVVGVAKKDSEPEVQSYLFNKEKWNTKESIKWVKAHQGKASSENIEWVTEEDISEAFEHQLEYDIVCKARILDINTLDQEALSAAGIDKLDKDLMAVEFKLVHANTNSNKDTFTKEEVQAASSTPVFKPINWQHTDRIIGVMSDSKFIEIAAEGSDGVEDGHIVASGVIYKYKFPTYAAEMLRRHDDDELFFSMETWFEEAECSVCSGRFVKKIDYCDHLKTRMAPESTATRILHGLTFSGAGVVENPADKQADSISIGEDQNVDNTKEDTDMPKKDEGQIVFESEQELKDYVAAEISKALESKDEKAEMTELKNDLKTATDKITELEGQLAEKDTDIQAKETEKATVQTEFDNYKENIEKDKKAQERVAELIEAGVKFPEDEEKKNKILASIKEMDEDTYAGYKDAVLGSIPAPSAINSQEDTAAEDTSVVDVPAVKAEDEDGKNSALKNILHKTSSHKKEDKDN